MINNEITEIMNTEEKARAYDEALDRMKHVVIVPKDEKALQALKETIFPELAESEDERIRKHLIAIVELYWGKTNDPDKAKELAYLEKQKEQKPADDKAFEEWSDEDEKTLNAIIDMVGNSLYEPLRPRAVILSWLNSLRPSWKPSEEQMAALDKAIPVCMGVVGRDEIAPLESLYEQLKKLM